MDCPHCQDANPEGARFCMACGNPLFTPCPECGTELPARARFCLNCGQQLNGTEADPSRARLEQYIPKELLAKLEGARTKGVGSGERRVVTMLFCDVTGSTSAAGRLDPEEWAEVMNGAFQHLITPIYRYEGTLARLMGDAILAFFGAPIAHEDDPQRAVLAGLDIIQGIRAYQEEVKPGFPRLHRFSLLWFVQMMTGHIVDKSVSTSDIIDQGLPVDEIRRRIRDEYIADATVTVVLIGRCTWQRKHVDWEISASLIVTSHNDRCGLLGIRLPSHTNFRDAEYNPRLIPPRLAYNCEGRNPFAVVHRWSGSENEVNRVRRWIDEAFSRGDRQPDPHNSCPLFANNRHTDCSLGWQS